VPEEIADLRNRHRGPVDWPWLSEAARLPGCALHVALAFHYQNGFKRTGSVRLSPSVWRSWVLSAFSVYRAVKQLEEAGLISVVRMKGGGPMITVCELDTR